MNFVNAPGLCWPSESYTVSGSMYKLDFNNFSFLASIMTYISAPNVPNMVHISHAYILCKISQNVKNIIEVYNKIYNKQNEFLQLLVSNFAKIKLTNNLN